MIELIHEIKSLFPDAPDSITINLYSSANQEVNFHGFKDYASGTEFLRSLGFADREKQIVGGDTESPWIAIKGRIGNTTFETCCAGLPPSCRKVTTMKKVPKQQTIDTGEFIEVPETRVVCGQEKEEVAA
jgi:hypothetical protein